eukprot:scaffold55425_cov72-Phaeocystis_antarctica.AAC.6
MRGILRGRGRAMSDTIPHTLTVCAAAHWPSTSSTWSGVSSSSPSAWAILTMLERFCTGVRVRCGVPRVGGYSGGDAGAAACLAELMLVDDDARELVCQLLARAEDIVATGEGGHLDPLSNRGHRLVEAGAEGGGRRGRDVEDAARLRLAREALFVVCSSRAGARVLDRSHAGLAPNAEADYLNALVEWKH